MLEYLLVKGADANFEREQFNARRWQFLSIYTLPLAIAAYMGNSTAIESLIKHGAEVDRVQKISGSETALSIALYACQNEAAKLLLAKGANVNAKSRGIMMTATHRSLGTLEIPFEGGASPENVQKALECAASAGQRDKVLLLLKHGANPDGFPEILEQSSTRGKEEVDGDLVAATPLVSAISSEWSYQADADQFGCLMSLLDADILCAGGKASSL